MRANCCGPFTKIIFTTLILIEKSVENVEVSLFQRSSSIKDTRNLTGRVPVGVQGTVKISEKTLVPT